MKGPCILTPLVRSLPKRMPQHFPSNPESCQTTLFSPRQTQINCPSIHMLRQEPCPPGAPISCSWMQRPAGRWEWGPKVTLGPHSPGLEFWPGDRHTRFGIYNTQPGRKFSDTRTFSLMKRRHVRCMETTLPHIGEGTNNIHAHTHRRTRKSSCAKEKPSLAAQKKTNGNEWNFNKTCLPNP